jgi:hypothetical protein
VSEKLIDFNELQIWQSEKLPDFDPHFCQIQGKKKAPHHDGRRPLFLDLN